MSDDLRTRAREAAAILYADPVKDSAAVYTRHALRYYQRSAKGKRPDAREDLYFYRVRQRSEMRWRR